jgi:hypothetical protein
VQGSLACQEPWSSGSASETLSTQATSPASATVGAGYFCFNYGNRGENPYHSVVAFGEARAAGHRVYAGAGAWDGTSYAGASPSYEAGCWVLAGADASAHWAPCPVVPAPWTPVVLGLLRDVAAADVHCQSAWNPLVQACAAGDARGTVLAVSACGPGRAVRVAAVGNRVDSAEGGFATCAATDLLLA